MESGVPFSTPALPGTLSPLLVGNASLPGSWSPLPRYGAPPSGVSAVQKSGGGSSQGSWSPFPGGGTASPLPGGAVPYPMGQGHGATGPAGSSFLNLFGESELSLQEIADRAHQLQQKIDENAEQEKANLRSAAEQKQQEIERHASELSRHAASSIEAYKSAQLQTAERQKAYQQAVVRQQAEQAKRMIDQQAAQAIVAVETRERHVDLRRQQQELMAQKAPPSFLSSPGGFACQIGGPPLPMTQLPPPGACPLSEFGPVGHGLSPPPLPLSAASRNSRGPRSAQVF